MPEQTPSCFRRTIAGAPPASTSSGATTTTSIYTTHLGPVSLTWSRTLLGLSLQILLPDNNLLFQIRPWLFWKKKGTKHLNRSIDVSWDLTRAKFHSSGGPEPWSNFFVAIATESEMLLVAGDMPEEAHRKTKSGRGTPATVLSRRDEVVLKPDVRVSGSRSYRTAVRVSGKERGISIEIGGKEKESVGLVVCVDGMEVLKVRRIKWKFRGREKVAGIQISWNLYGWLFPAKEFAAGDGGGDSGQAVFVFMFEEEEEGGKEEVGFGGKGEEFEGGGMSGCLGKGKRKSLSKTRSSSSSCSSASSAGSSSVMDWASPEEDELRGGGGFSLVVHAWKG